MPAERRGGGGTDLGVEVAERPSERTDGGGRRQRAGDLAGFAPDAGVAPVEPGEDALGSAGGVQADRRVRGGQTDVVVGVERAARAMGPPRLRLSDGSSRAAARRVFTSGAVRSRSMRSATSGHTTARAGGANATARAKTTASRPSFTRSD